MRGRIAKSFWSSSTTMTEWVGDDREVVVGIVVELVGDVQLAREVELLGRA